MTRPTAARVALVTGASSGIGEATARGLAADGFAVALVARRVDRLRALQEELEADGGRATVVEADLTDPEQCLAAVHTGVDRFGRLDVLVNNAGTSVRAPVLDADWRDWDTMLRLNTLAPMVCTHAALPALLDSTGTVVFVSSASGRRAVPTASGYVASKFAVTGFAETLRQEVAADGVRVAVVEPGFVDTPLAAGVSHPDLVPLDAEDVADAVRYVVAQPAHVAVNEVLLRPARQTS
ncbi:SDR family oxidoreductase [Rhodococcus aerolatus]